MTVDATHQVQLSTIRGLSPLPNFNRFYYLCMAEKTKIKKKETGNCLCKKQFTELVCGQCDQIGRF